jgi:hypothetical protein
MQPNYPPPRDTRRSKDYNAKPLPRTHKPRKSTETSYFNADGNVYYAYEAVDKHGQKTWIVNGAEYPEKSLRQAINAWKADHI